MEKHFLNFNLQSSVSVSRDEHYVCHVSILFIIFYFHNRVKQDVPQSFLILAVIPEASQCGSGKRDVYVSVSDRHKYIFIEIDLDIRNR